MKNSPYFSTTLFFLLVFTFQRQSADGGGTSQVKFLPGFQGPLPFHLETGYIGVDEGENVQLFYSFVKSKSSNPEKNPVLLWLIGGPGCSSLSSLLFETGPLLIDREDDEGLPTLSIHPHTLTEAANMIYLDLPVGTGYSYARTPEALRSTGLQGCEHAHQFIRKWVFNHPEFASNSFYVGGVSYVGVIIPVIVHLISSGNDAGINPRINLTGYVLGNPGTFANEGNYRIPFAYGMGLISNELYKSLKQNCNRNYMDVDSNNFSCLKDVRTFHQLVGDLFNENILETKCDAPLRDDGKEYKEKIILDNKLDGELHNDQYFTTNLCYSLKHTCKANYVEEDSSTLQCSKNVRTLHQMVEHFSKQILQRACDVSPSRRSSTNKYQELHNNKQLPPMRLCYNYRLKFIDPWASDPHVQEALHVRKEFVGKFVRCNFSIPHTDFLWDSIPYHVNLSAKGYRSLIYSGDHDMLVPFQSTQAWIRSLNYSIVDEWRPWFVEGLVAGYTRSYANNMTFATIKGGSHTPGASHPRECATMFKRWLSYQPL